jgi:hypothetical protein
MRHRPKVSLYVSPKGFALKRIPKYLLVYSLRSLYNIITNKLSQYGLVIERKVMNTKTITDPRSHLVKKHVHLIPLYNIKTDCTFK